MKDLKESNTVELTRYALAYNIDHKPTFDCWILITQRKRNSVVSKLHKKYCHTTHKFGIAFPTLLKRAHNI